MSPEVDAAVNGLAAESGGDTEIEGTDDESSDAAHDEVVMMSPVSSPLKALVRTPRDSSPAEKNKNKEKKKSPATSPATSPTKSPARTPRTLAATSTL